MKFNPKADPVLESGVKSFEINYFCTFRFINLLFMALMNLWNLNDVENVYGKSDCECYIHNASEMSQLVCFVNVPLRPM